MKFPKPVRKGLQNTAQSSNPYNLDTKSTQCPLYLQQNDLYLREYFISDNFSLGSFADGRNTRRRNGLVTMTIDQINVLAHAEDSRKAHSHYRR